MFMLNNPNYVVRKKGGMETTITAHVTVMNGKKSLRALNLLNL